MNDMKRLLSYAGPYKRDMIFGAVLVLVETCFELFIPILISNLIDIGVANGDIPLHLPQGNPDGNLRALCACDRNFIRALCGAGDVRLGS